VTARYQLLPLKINVSQDPLSLLDMVSEACWYNDGPIDTIAEVAKLRLVEAARSRGIKVLLCGQGADEQLGGYAKFLFFWLQELVASGKYWGAVRTFVEVVQRTTMLRQFQLSEAMRYIGPSWLSKHTFIAPIHQNRDTVDLGSHGTYAHREWVDLAQMSLPTILHSEDRMSMARSVEMRVPFLDHRLVECLARVHPSEKFNGGWPKSIFRDAVADILPAEIRFRRDKNGFAVPEDAWVRGVFSARFLEMIRGTMRAEELGFISRPALLHAYRKFMAGRGRLNGRHFFRAYAFEIFLRRFDGWVDG
jgi:asparagine synthase (glutamine-hydrolysing)